MDSTEFIGEMRVWTERDFDFMGWHDATIHGIIFQPEKYSLVFDLDYILKWVEPTPPEEYFTFWVAPATLTFQNVSDLTISLQADLPGLTLFGIERDDEQPTPNGRFQSWRYTLDGDQGTISFRATGFTQQFRNFPIQTRQQSLSASERGDF